MESKVFGLRLNDGEKKALEREARRHGLSLAAYIKCLAKLRVEFKVEKKDNTKK